MGENFLFESKWQGGGLQSPIKIALPNFPPLPTPDTKQMIKAFRPEVALLQH